MDRYQDAWLPGSTVSGERDCAARWDLIEPWIPRRGMILDVGSNLGYFGLRAAARSSGVAVVSLEADPHIAALQAEIVAANGTDRVAVLQGTVSSASTGAWADACDWFDLTLLLSVLHWTDDPAAVVRNLSSMSGAMVCEVPDPLDSGACGQEKLTIWTDAVKWFGEVTGRSARLIGHMTRHTSAVPSPVVLVEGPVTRRPTKAYWSSGYAHPRGADYRFDYDGQELAFAVRGESRPWLAGVNVVNLMKLGALRAPQESWWRDAARAELNEHPHHPDPLPHNLVWGPSGVRLIDFEAVDARHTPADGLRTLSANLDQWRAGATVAADVIVRRLSVAQRLRYSSVGRATVGRLPAPLKRLLRRLPRRSA